MDNALQYRWTRITRSGMLRHLSGVDLRLLLCYDDCVNFPHWTETGELEAWPSIPTLARRTGDDAGNVKRRRRRLIKLGLLRRKAKGGNGPGDTTHFLLSLPNEAEADSATYLSLSQLARREADWNQKEGRRRTPKRGAGAPLRGAPAPPIALRQRASYAMPLLNDRVGAGARQQQQPLTIETQTMDNSGDVVVPDGGKEGRLQLRVLGLVELLAAAGFPFKAAQATAATPGVTPERVQRVIRECEKRSDLSNPVGWMRDRLVNGWDLIDDAQASGTEADREDIQRKQELRAALVHSDQATLDWLDDAEWARIHRTAIGMFKDDQRAAWFSKAKRSDLANPEKFGQLRSAMAGIARAMQSVKVGAP